MGLGLCAHIALTPGRWVADMRGTRAFRRRSDLARASVATIIIAIYLGAAIGIAANLLLRLGRPIRSRDHLVESDR